MQHLKRTNRNMFGVFVLLILFINGPSFASNNKKKNFKINAIKIQNFCTDKYGVSDNKGREGTYYICKDNSISYLQTDDNYRRKGLCGSTAAVNVIRTYCGNAHTVQDFDSKFVRHLEAFGYKFNPTSGTYLGNLVDALNRAWSFYCDSKKQNQYKWRLKSLTSAKLYLQYIYDSLNWNGISALSYRILEDGSVEDKWPLITVLNYKSEKNSLHYVTVVDIETEIDLSSLYKMKGSLKQILNAKKCEVRYNTWGAQFQLNCLEFVKWASGKNINYFLKDFIRFKVIDLISL